MNADLERTLSEMGPEYRDVVERLRRAPEVEPRLVRPAPFRRAYLAAASLAAVALFGVFVWMRPAAVPGSRGPAYGAREYRMSVDELIATQRADGSWQNDFLTRRNAELLKASGDPRAHLAYRKAMRNLRLRGG